MLTPRVGGPGNPRGVDMSLFAGGGE